MNDLSHITKNQCKEVARIINPVFFSSSLSGNWEIVTFEDAGLSGGGFRIRNKRNDYKLDFDFMIPQDIELVNIHMGDHAGTMPISGGDWYKVFNKLNEWGLYLKQS